ncbi:MAG: hypothetical protein IBX69_18420 [Anaerolineales bacterium]|nr:hypothetical protein [Anaerolineales bacterium]
MSEAVIVHVTVPADAMAGDSDVVTITATSANNPELSAYSELTTTANVVYALMLEPEADALSAEPGETVEYTLTLTNTGNALDTFELEAGESEWVVHLPETSFELAAGASAEIIVHVTIPADAADGDFDVVVVTATSLGDEEVFASSTLTTSAVVPEPEFYYLFTPIVNKN